MDLINQGKLEAAYNMYLKGYNLRTIIDITGLTEEQILRYIKDQERQKDK